MGLCIEYALAELSCPQGLIVRPVINNSSSLNYILDCFEAIFVTHASSFNFLRLTALLVTSGRVFAQQTLCELYLVSRFYSTHHSKEGRQNHHQQNYTAQNPHPHFPTHSQRYWYRTQENNTCHLWLNCLKFQFL